MEFHALRNEPRKIRIFVSAHLKSGPEIKLSEKTAQLLVLYVLKSLMENFCKICTLVIFTSVGTARGQGIIRVAVVVVETFF